MIRILILIYKAMQKEKIKYCTSCGNIGHKKGLCTSDTLEISFAGNPNIQNVLIFSSMDSWSRGEKMVKDQYTNIFTIAKSFKIGRNEFKFLVDGHQWELSSVYPNLTTPQGIVNNYVDIKWKLGESVIVRSNHTIKNLIEGVQNDNVEFIIILNEISFNEMKEKSKISNHEVIDIVEIWGSWNNFEQGDLMNSYCDKQSRLESWTFKKALLKGLYFYKFRINGIWALDPFRESRSHNNLLLHPLDFAAVVESDLRELTRPAIVNNKIKVNVFEHEEILDVELTGHSMNGLGNKVYILGGKDRDSYTNNIFVIEFNPFRLKLIEVVDNNGPTSIAFHKTISYGEKLIVYGGHNNVRVSDSYHTYSTLNKIWTTFKIMNPLVREMYSAVYKKLSSRIYIFGGFYCHPDSEGEFHFNDIHVLYLNLMSFQALNTKNPPIGRYSHSAVLINWTMFVFGGCRNDGMKRTCFNDLHSINLFDHDNLVWEEIECKGSRPPKRFNHLCLNNGPQIIIYGGTGEGLSAPLLGDFWIFNIRNLTWMELLFQNPEMDFRRTQHAGCIMDNKLIVFGGKTLWSCEYSDKILQFNFEYSN
jgi:hypothetical protein